MVLLLNTVLILTVTCFTVKVEADTEVNVSLNDISNSSPILVCREVLYLNVGEGVLYL